MNLSELCKAAHEVLEHPDKQTLQRLTRRAGEIASLTGWAPGQIDPEGRFDTICQQLLHKARQLYEQNQQQEIAELHDALAELRETVARHDDDLRPDSSEGDDAEPFTD